MSWVLNLKQTSTSYQSDGSYEIKCEFIPSQWGFMSDLPFLFLLATKGLKKNELPDDKFKKYNIISLDDYSSGYLKNHIKNTRVKYIRGHTKNISSILKKYKNKEISWEECNELCAKAFITVTKSNFLLS